ncbi:ADP-ribosylglycohydrolase family protein [Chengkuizengella marina]|uniref:ADP-ribosylglycohydrolase family protein n=1 Tax=Chengkuizengella marina TaxID=2507566 RepID=A0A6N9Q8G4_9BACL|nr:ADP-ribosylglycohydrolase family protein [Chengkuizengella marina]NBI31142.1 ADP-ribosylglycohydrolase family protein [Chengkuizengella marina]
MLEKVTGGLFGFCVGDALGVPVEFVSRQSLKKKPVIDMRCYGTHNQPAGTWSDDSSLTFCLVESLCNGYNPFEIAQFFLKWLKNGYWTPHGKVFDIGQTTVNALYNFEMNMNPIHAGGKSIHDNGNGSLMRILPLAFYLRDCDESERHTKIHQVSSITHAHPRSLVACSIYVEFALNILMGFDQNESYLKMQKSIKSFFSGRVGFEEELMHFSQILEGDVSKLSEEDIESSGYVVHTLQASIWSFLTTYDYKNAVLKSINLGGDTDTTGAVTGGIAGLYYGFKDIPTNWTEQIVKKEEILDLINRFYEVVSQRSGH